MSMTIARACAIPGLPTLFALVAWSGAGASAADAAPRPVPGQGLFVAVGYGGFRGWSLDGQVWSAERWSDKNADDPNIISSLTYRAGIFLCSGGGVGKGFILRSSDGRHWDEVAHTRWRIASVVTLPDRFLSVYDDHFQASVDGQGWQALAAAHAVAADGKGSGYFRRTAVGNGAAVFAGDYALPDGKPRIGWLGGTRNGETPMVVTTVAADCCGLAFGGGRFLACSSGGDLLSSSDGLHFTPLPASNDHHDDDSLRFHDGLFYLRGKKGVRTSPDGMAWTPLPNPPRLAHAQAPDRVAVDGGWGGIVVASDGINFNQATVPIDATGICAVAWGIPLANLPPAAKATKP
jgi:hypothetical protein